MPKVKDDNSLGMFNTLSNLVKVKRYSFGVLAQIFYVGAQIMCWTYIYQYAESKGISNVEAGNYQMGAFVLFVIGRAAGTALLSKIKAGQLLAFFAAGGVGMLNTCDCIKWFNRYVCLGNSIFFYVFDVPNNLWHCLGRFVKRRITNWFRRTRDGHCWRGSYAQASGA